MTEKKRRVGDPASDEFRELRRQRQILDSLNEAVVTSDLDGVVTEWSGGAERLWGYSADEVVGKYHYMLLDSAQDYTPEEEILAKLVEEGRSDFEQKILTKSGVALTAHLSMSLLKNDEGEPEGFIALLNDITGQKATERDLWKSEEQFRRVFQEAPLGMAMVGLQGELLAVNDRFCNMMGYTADELKQMCFQDITHPDDMQLSLDVQAEARDSEAPFFQFQKRYLTKSGDTLWTHLTSSIIRDEQGNPLYNIGMVEDITERKRAEEQLRQASKMEAVGQLTGGVAHDFNNLLAIILGNLELAGERLGGNERIQPLLDRAYQAGERGAGLTQRLLAFSRQQVLAPAVIDLNAILEDTADILKRALGEHIEITSTLGTDLWLCLADRSQIENAVLNLALNARDAMPEGGHLSLETQNVLLDDEYTAAEAELEPGEYVMLSVSDTGQGIAPEHQLQIFEPFFTTKKVGEGSGLGLSMIYGFVKQSGGHMSVYSELGEGTTFRTYLPRTRQGLVEQDPVDAEQDEDTAPEATILVVEDNHDVRALTVALLSDMGYGVLEAKSGPAALEKIKEGQHFDLLLTDVVLPGGMTGPVLAAKVRQGRPGVPVLFMSGYAKQALAQANRLKGTEAFLQKPFRKKDLANIVRETLLPPTPD